MPQNDLWLEEMVPQIVDATDMPKTWGSPPQFPYEMLSKELGSVFSSSDISIEAGKKEFKSREALIDGFGSHAITLSFSLSPLEGAIHWIMSKEDVSGLVHWLKDENGEALQAKHPDMIRGLYRYIMLEVLAKVQSVQVYHNISPKLTETALPETPAFAVDVEVKNGEEMVPGRLIFSKEFQQSFVNHYAFERPTLKDLENVPDVKVPLSITAGSTQLSPEEFEALSEGDFLIIENCYYSPAKQKGSFQMSLQHTPLFQVKKKESSLKILDFIYFYEDRAMDDEDLPPMPEENMPPADEFGSTNVPPLETPEAEVPAAEAPFDQAIPAETPIPPAAPESPIPPAAPAAEAPAAPEIPEEDEPESLDAALEENPVEQVDIAKLPLTVNVEISRIKMTLEELKKLAPGSQIPVSLNTNKVELVVNGKSIGNGTLIQLEDMVGVKIVEKYS